MEGIVSERVARDTVGVGQTLDGVSSGGRRAERHKAEGHGDKPCLTPATYGQNEAGLMQATWHSMKSAESTYEIYLSVYISM